MRVEILQNGVKTTLEVPFILYLDPTTREIKGIGNLPLETLLPLLGPYISALLSKAFAGK